MPSVASLIRAYSRRYGIDPRAALAVARQEGGLRWGAVGDSGTSYGPFQLHEGGALPRGRNAAWANSPSGIAYAVQRMAASGARGLTGRAAVEAIVRNFERPADPGSEIARALAAYGLSGTGSSPAAATQAYQNPAGSLAAPAARGPANQPAATPSSPANFDKLLALVNQVRAAKAAAAQAPASTPATSSASPSASPSGGEWGGSKHVAYSLTRNLGLTSTSEKRSTRSTASGGVSDHWTGSRTAYARDMSGSVAAMDAAAVRLAHELGLSYRRGQPLVATFYQGAYRIQILYRTMTGGNHFDHIHVGVRRR
jgi:hypothetical protein